MSERSTERGSEPAREFELDQEPPRIQHTKVAVLGLGVVVGALALVGVAWLFVAAPPVSTRGPLPPSTLEHGLIERATGGADARASGARRLAAPAPASGAVAIDRAIDEVVARPSLLDGSAAPPDGGAGDGGAGAR